MLECNHCQQLNKIAQKIDKLTKLIDEYDWKYAKKIKEKEESEKELISLRQQEGKAKGNTKKNLKKCIADLTKKVGNLNSELNSKKAEIEKGEKLRIERERERNSPERELHLFKSRKGKLMIGNWNYTDRNSI